MRFLFFVDGERGEGHLVRSSALMGELVRRGHSCSRFGATKLVNSVVDYDVIVFDGYGWTWEEFTRFGKPTALITDYLCSSPDDQKDHRQGDAPVDLLVNGSASGFGNQKLTGDGLRYQAPRYARRVLSGPEYALIRPEFSQLRWGANLSGGVLDVRKLEGLSGEQVAGAMASALVGISYGGMTSLEAACVGLPTILIERDGDEEGNCVMLSTVGASQLIRSDTWTFILRDHGEIKAESWLAAQAENMITEYVAQVRARLQTVKLVQMSEAGRSLVDGLGVNRVAQAVEELA